MMRLTLCLALIPACFHPSYEAPQCGVGGECPSGFSCSADNVCVRGLGNDPPTDAALDAAPVDAKPMACLGTFQRVCVEPPSGDLALASNTIIDTDTSTLCVPYTSTPTVDACVVAARAITISAGAVVRATGKKKLILLATDTNIALSGSLNASSTMYPMTVLGPGAGQDACNAGTLPTMTEESGGGAGGSFGSIGGKGGNTPDGGKGGVAGATLPSTAFHSGCAGQNAAQGGPGGAGGGAVALIAKGTITIAATVNASGAGGQVSSPFVEGGGGGGGGAGGMIVLDADRVEMMGAGRCFANGGGGAQGSGSTAGARGGDPVGPSNPAAGGDGGTTAGGEGGDGAFRTIAAGAGAPGRSSPTAAGGGGGGGGGTGYIILVAKTDSIPNATVSPEPTRP